MLPEGVIYFREGSKCFCVKDESIFDQNEYPIDFFYTPLNEIASRNLSNYIETIDLMLEKKHSADLNYYGFRDGLFEMDETFFVYEKKDLHALISYIEKALKIEIHRASKQC